MRQAPPMGLMATQHRLRPLSSLRAPVELTSIPTGGYTKPHTTLRVLYSYRPIWKELAFCVFSTGALFTFFVLLFFRYPNWRACG